jgi:hypothetical protein
MAYLIPHILAHPPIALQPVLPMCLPCHMQQQVHDLRMPNVTARPCHPTPAIVTLPPAAAAPRAASTYHLHMHAQLPDHTSTINDS